MIPIAKRILKDAKQKAFLHHAITVVFPTPEATPEKQTERDKHWKKFVRVEVGKEFHYIEHMTEENRKEYKSRKKREELDVYGNVRLIK